MFRLLFLALSFFLFSKGLSAQADDAASARHTTQQLSPTDATLQQETKEMNGFARKLASLKTAFAEKDASRIVAYEAYLLNAMRTELDQISAKATATSGEMGAITQTRLEKMTHIFAAFEGHAFDPAQPEAAARDFAKLDEFLKLMQEELK